MCVLPFRVGAVKAARDGARDATRTLPVSLWSETLTKNPGIRRLMIIDGVSELWNPNRLEIMEALISFASEHKVPVWVFDDEIGRAHV